VGEISRRITSIHRKGNAFVKVAPLLEFLHAAHHTWLVQSEWEERGGIMIIAPPGAWKTTLCYTLDSYTDAKCLGDVNIKSMHVLREQILSGTYRTLVFGELEKLYARNPATAANIEGVLKQLIEEGLRQFSFENPSASRMPARAMVLCAVTPSIYGKLMTAWVESGFLRRFLRMQYTMADPSALIDAIRNWKKIEFDMPSVWTRKQEIKFNLDKNDTAFIGKIMKYNSDSTPNVLMQKIACVLKYRKPDQWHAIIESVGDAMGRNGALLHL
jgi:hypothetical protein